MTFYFKPPRGNIPLHKLQECVEERISYLDFVRESTDISECHDHFKFEYLIDGSALDRTGHFMLRLVALKLKSLEEFLLESEPILFTKRLRFLKHNQIDKELRIARRHVKEILFHCQPLPKYQVFLKHFVQLCEDMIESKAISHTFTDEHDLSCQDHCVLGKVIVPCGKWSQLLGCLFGEHLKHGMQQLLASNSYTSMWDDDRVRYLFRVLKLKFNQNAPSNAMSKYSTLRANEVDQTSLLFPPCMRNMHITLRQRHRLSHYSRFYYSLFLKDIGMPLMESIEFWSKEYAQSTGSCTSCSHSWQKDGRKYVYSLRHMYGLEGSRREYHTPCCQQVQNMSSSPLSDGGCPFLSFDDKKLLNCLHNQIKFDVLSTVGNDKSAKEKCHIYLDALKSFYAEKVSSTEGNKEIIASNQNSTPALSPSQFYFTVKKT
ncbi:DNA primase large subunit-like isoform X2 [Thrips palmi]|uniref:DNA primase large subunit-like isoform X2 n=1 Tax=Thrips palmi TaxID=161013 RepID=A0A6P9AEW4_THRPL|nr:DNA primase large subunit-like isoform X2 [Thrips palmi]